MGKKINFKNSKKQIIENEVDYIVNYIKDNTGDVKTGKSSSFRIALGCDSFNRKGKSLYAITIVLYDEFKHNGAHVISKTIKIPKYLVAQGYITSQWMEEPYKEGAVKKINDGENGAIFNRLYNEAQYLLELGLHIDSKLQDKYYRKHEKNEYDGSHPYRLPELHVDFNSDEGEGKQNKSNIVYQTCMGMLCGQGFKVISKPDSWASSRAADAINKNKLYKV